jgi:inward rectifier potassium channel
MKISNLTKSFKSNQNNAENDLGFGTRVVPAGGRLINKDGSYNIVRRGLSAWFPYQSLVEMPWINFLGLITLVFLAINAFFATIFVFIGVENLSGAVHHESLFSEFASAFFFSVQTFTTVGYGAISPDGALADSVAAIDALVGLLSFALATGLLFARFAKPKANILFSDHALIRPYKDTPYKSFQFQIVNRRNNKIINLDARVVLSWIDKEGEHIRRKFLSMPLERNHIYLFPLNWIIVHVIDADSPLWQWEEKDFKEKEVEILVLMRGYDETFAQDVHASSSYMFYEIEWDKRFEPMYYAEDGRTVIELDRVHNMVPLDEEE